MVSGKAIDTKTKQLIYDHHCSGKIATEIHDFVFFGRNDTITLSYLKKVCQFFNRSDDISIYNYINSNFIKTRRSRTSKFNPMFKVAFNKFERKHFNKKVKYVVREFNMDWFGSYNPPNGLKLSTAKNE